MMDMLHMSKLSLVLCKNQTNLKSTIWKLSSMLLLPKLEVVMPNKTTVDKSVAVDKSEVVDKSEAVDKSAKRKLNSKKKKKMMLTCKSIPETSSWVINNNKSTLMTSISLWAKMKEKELKLIIRTCKLKTRKSCANTAISKSPNMINRIWKWQCCRVLIVGINAILIVLKMRLNSGNLKMKM